jgi:hypothetical protein
MPIRGTKKEGSKRPEKLIFPMNPSEIVNCYLVEYKTAGRPMLIYQKISDSTIHGAWIHPDTDLKYLKKIIKQWPEFDCRPPLWISLGRQPFSTPQGEIDALVIGHVAESLDDIIKEISNRIISPKRAVMLAVQSTQRALVKF